LGYGAKPHCRIFLFKRQSSAILGKKAANFARALPAIAGIWPGRGNERTTIAAI
jgi:hypothetical protein